MVQLAVHLIQIAELWARVLTFRCLVLYVVHSMRPRSCRKAADAFISVGDGGTITSTEADVGGLEFTLESKHRTIKGEHEPGSQQDFAKLMQVQVR